MDFIQAVASEFIAGLLGTLLGILFKIGFDRVIRRRRAQTIRSFLNFPQGEIVIVHSALFDSSRHSYNYPSCDMVSSRRLSGLLESIGLKEGQDFSVAPESNFLTSKGEVNLESLRCNLILLGGPKRNKITAEILKGSVKPRYDMHLDESGENVLYDSFTRNHLKASRDDPQFRSQSDDNDEGYGYDYGLVMTMANPLNLDHGVLIIAGIHGPGTIGASTFITDKKSVALMISKRHGGVIQEVVYAKYACKTDRIIEVSMI